MITANKSAFKYANWSTCSGDECNFRLHRLDIDSWLKEAANLQNPFPLGLIHSTLRFLQATLGSKAVAPAAEEFKTLPEANRK